MIVFEVYNPYSIVQLSEVLDELTVHQGERDVYRGRAVITGLLNTGLMLIVTASLVDPWSDLKGLEPGEVLRSFVHDFVADWEKAIQRLGASYQLSVTSLRNYLQELSRWLEHWETEAGINERVVDPRRIMEFVRDVDQEIEPRLTDLYGAFEVASHEIPRKYVPYYRAFAQRELHPLMMCAPFMNRAFNKPLGYAGDYEMVRMMLSDPWEGGNTFAKVLNASSLRHEAPAAHRNRIEHLVQTLQSETKRALAQQASADSVGHVNGLAERVSIMSLGCGPAVEAARFAAIDDAASHVDLKLVDFNSETLQHVHDNLIPEVARVRPEMRVTTERRSVHEIIQLSVEGGSRGKEADVMPEYDMVYCAGLFDYFRDTTCGFLIELFYQWVKPGGLVVVTNVTRSHSSVAIMSLVLDWNLELRDERDMKLLAPNLGEQRTYVDATGVNVFLEIRKPLAGP